MKKRRVLVITGAVLAALLIAGLWYTRPQNLADVIGVEEPVSLSASVSDHTADFEGYGAAPGIDTWRLNGVKPGDPAMDAVMDALRGGSCRASLRNLLNHTVFYPANYSVGGSTDGYIDVQLSSGQGGEAAVSVLSDGQVWLYFQEDGRGYYTFHGDSGLFETLAGVIREYGTHQES